jgi:hypothetical protein
MLAVELVMLSDNRPSFNWVIDLQMLLLFGGGRIRTEAEFRTIFARADLRVNQFLPTFSPNTIIEAMPA